MTQRDIFSELTDGFDALKAERAGNLTLRRFTPADKPVPPSGYRSVPCIAGEIHHADRQCSRPDGVGIFLNP